MSNGNDVDSRPLLENDKLDQSSKRVRLSVPEPTQKKSITEKVPRDSTPPSFAGGIVVMLFVTFLSSVCFSIVLPSIWPYLRDRMHQPKSMVGWAVAVNSAGSFLASPLFGSWADRRSSREVVLVTLIVMVIGNVIYSIAADVWMLLVGRFVVGMASANYAVAQTYLSYATTVENRTKVMAINSACTVLGFIIGPSMAFLTSYVDFEVKGIKVDSYTMPGYISAIFSIFSMLSLVFLKEIPASYKRSKKPVTGNSSKTYGSGFYTGGGSIKDVSQLLKMSGKIPILPVTICLLCYFAFTTSFTVFETVGTAYTKGSFPSWGVRENSIMYIILGAVCVTALFFLQIFVRFFNDRILLILTTAIAVAGFALLFDTDRDGYVAHWRFWLGASLCSASYSTSVAVLISTYSKILENLDQGMLMGWLSSSGSIARIVGPVVASYAMQYGGESGYTIFILMIAMMGATTVLEIVSYKFLVPRNTTTSINTA